MVVRRGNLIWPGAALGVQNMFAVFASGGKQHRVTEGEVIRIERLAAEPGEEVVFDKVLMVADGDQVSVGTRFVDGGKVTAEVIGNDRGKKINVLKFKRRKDYLRRQGHRQWFTELKITGINA
jgi:large subunit ribosomal protein L21